MRPSIIIPFNGDPARKKAFDRVHRWYGGLLGWEIVVSLGDPGKPFCKGKLVNQGVEKAQGDTLVIIDADTIISTRLLKQGIENSWCRPFNRLLRFNEDGTHEVIENFDRAGGVWIIDREIFNLVGGVDDRFTWWGGEDDSFCRAVDTLYRPAVVLEGIAAHLWHPPPEGRLTFMRRDNRKLWERYCNATGDRKAMRALVDEISRPAADEPARTCS